MSDSPFIPLSLYIHTPWCERKCPYCDFNSHQMKPGVNEADYIEQLLLDLDTDLRVFENQINDRTIQTIFIGGGTPSLFSENSYHTLFEQLGKRLNLARNAEITLEANPGSSEVHKFEGFRQAGINRLSIGIQSFNASHLQVLGRVHSTQEGINAASHAKAAGFNNFNLDLMFGLPEQSLDQALDDLAQAIELQPTHLSCYQLTIEPNTLFHHRPPVTPGDDTLWAMQSRLQDLMANSGYRQYEVSAYAKSGNYCQHNLNYWQFGDYLGIGAGAHGKLTNSAGQITRMWKVKHPTTYLNKEDKIGGQNVVDTQQVPFEFMMNALRLKDGFTYSLFVERCAQPLSSIKPLLDKHESQGLIETSPTGVITTQLGFNMINNLLEDYLNIPA